MPEHGGRPFPSKGAGGGDGAREGRPAQGVPEGRRRGVHTGLGPRPPEFGGKKGVKATSGTGKNGGPKKGGGVSDQEK